MCILEYTLVWKLSEYILSKYAPTLNAEDMLYLFSKLIKAHGSIKKAAEECKITRRSYYMLENREYIQPNTKEKIVKTTYGLSPDEVLEYLLKRHVDDSLEVLSVNLSKLYEEAIEETDRESLTEILEEFDRIKQEYEGLIIDNIQREVLDQIAHLKEKAEIAEVLWKPAKTTMFKTYELTAMIPLVFKELEAGKKPETISEKYGVSPELVKAIASIQRKEITATLSEYEGFLYGKIEEYDPMEYWNRELASAAGPETPRYMVYNGGGLTEHQTPTAQAITYPPGKGAYLD